MNYEVMEIRRPKRKNSAEKIKKYQFKTKEETDAFAQASPFHTQVYKIEVLKNNKKS